MSPPPRLAIVASHPTQYYAPWFAHLAQHLRASIEVFYLWDFGVAQRYDPGFDLTLRWDLDLLSGYAHRFVPNQSTDPGTHHFSGLRNPNLPCEVAAWKPDAVLVFGYRSWSHFRLFASRGLWRAPFLFRGDSHLLAEPMRPRPLKQAALTLLFQRFTAFLPVGTANAAYFQRYGVPDHRLFFTPHAIDNARFSAVGNEKAGRAWRRELGIADDDRLILFAGKFERNKRPDLLLRAFRSLAPTRATLLLVGNGKLEGELRRLSEGADSIRFVPFQNQGAMPRVHAAADLLVLPSEGAGESWGLVVNEAQCAGRAVLVSDHVGCHLDLVRAEENGLVFRAGSEGALRQALAEALSDDAGLRAWGAAGRKLVDRYSYEAATVGLQRALDFAVRGGCA
jgi:glycosyltransferase involved in cell wall biosynthesis